MGPRKFLTIAFAVFALLNSAQPQMICSTSVLDQSVRQVILNLHNDLRKRVAIGVARPAPRGQNIYALTYSCALEQSAQNAAAKCTGLNSSPSERPNIGENVYAFSGPDVKATAFVHAIVTWRNPAGWTGGNVFTTAMNASTLRNFAQMAWGSTTLIGCGYQHCGSFQSVVCHYVSEAKVNEAAYQLGQGCIRDQDCTTFDFSTCDRGLRLCRAPAGTSLPPVVTTAASAQSTDCPDSPLNANIRKVILSRHNSLRSQVARMTQIAGHKFKRGTDRMFALRYSCALEATANRLADLCPPPPPENADPVPPTRGRNYHSDTKDPADPIGVSVSTAITEWIKQGIVFDDNEKLGMGVNTLPAVGHIAQMINARTYEIGCGYGSCGPTRKDVLCIYRTARSDTGVPYNPITTRGCTPAGCRASVANATCNTTSGLCQIP